MLFRSILATIDALKLDRVHLAAHSLGGAEVTQLATTRPDRVASIVYLDAALDAAPAEAIRRQAPVPNPQPPPGTPFAQVQELPFLARVTTTVTTRSYRGCDSTVRDATLCLLLLEGTHRRAKHGLESPTGLEYFYTLVGSARRAA